MRRNRVLLLAVLAAGLLAGLLVALRSGPSSEPSVALGTAAVSTAAQSARRPFVPLGEVVAEGTELMNNHGPADEESADGTHSHVDDALQEVLDSDPQLRKFYRLRLKVLRSSSEQQEYLAMISDPKLIAAARRDLLDAFSGAEIDQVDEVRRLQRIQFMNSALAWSDNPERAHALSAVSEVVMVNLPATVSKDTIGSLLGDKFDLFQLLMATDPTQAEALLTQARGTRSEKILQLAWSTGAPSKNNKTP